jgi:hypothetical protein
MLQIIVAKARRENPEPCQLLLVAQMDEAGPGEVDVPLKIDLP